VLLAVLQGVAEFLPISSSGHLALAQIFLPGIEPDVAFDVLLHVGTLAAVVGYFRADLYGLARGIFRPAAPHPERPFAGRERRTVLLLGLATVATVGLALAIKDVAERAFHQPSVVGLYFLCTAVLLALCRFAPEDGRGIGRFAWWKALVVGLAQGVAVFPGISRSGATIAACLLLGLERRAAARFSLLLSLPAILGAFLLKAKDLNLTNATVGPMILALIVTFGVGWASIHLLLRSVHSGWFHRFFWYCALLGSALLLLSLRG
jgi:undecaprenyl-diphosphatase